MMDKENVGLVEEGLSKMNIAGTGEANPPVEENKEEIK